MNALRRAQSFTDCPKLAGRQACSLECCRWLPICPLIAAHRVGSQESSGMPASRRDNLDPGAGDILSQCPYSFPEVLALRTPSAAAGFTENGRGVSDPRGESARATDRQQDVLSQLTAPGRALISHAHRQGRPDATRLLSNRPPMAANGNPRAGASQRRPQEQTPQSVLTIWRWPARPRQNVPATDCIRHAFIRGSGGREGDLGRRLLHD
jgi:hypothetical protein